MSRMTKLALLGALTAGGMAFAATPSLAFGGHGAGGGHGGFAGGGHGGFAGGHGFGGGHVFSGRSVGFDRGGYGRGYGYGHRGWYGGGYYGGYCGPLRAAAGLCYPYYAY